MDKISTNNNIESSPSSETNDDDNVSKLSHVAEQQQQQTNKIGPRPRFCNDVLLDALYFLRRCEHAQVRLASQRLQRLSYTTCTRYPPRVVPALEMRGVYALPLIADANVVPHMDAAGPWFVANSMRVFPVGNSHLVDVPAVKPPKDIVNLSHLAIYDFIGPELLQFLRVSARLLRGGSWMVFNDFDNFVSHHSADFITRFFALFPSEYAIELRRLSALTAPLFIDHPTIFDCTVLIVYCLDTFPLDALQHWLHHYEQQSPKQQNKRYLFIRFGAKVEADHSSASSLMQQLRKGHSIDNFVQQIRQRFIGATSCCSFSMTIQLMGKWAQIPQQLDPFVEHNEQTRELLEFIRPHYDRYVMKRRRRERAGQEEGDREAEATYKTMVYIHKVVQGDKRVVDSSSG